MFEEREGAKAAGGVGSDWVSSHPEVGEGVGAFGEVAQEVGEEQNDGGRGIGVNFAMADSRFKASTKKVSSVRLR